MEQVTFADVEYEGKKRRTRRELFLERMEALIPWERLDRPRGRGRTFAVRSRRRRVGGH